MVFDGSTSRVMFLPFPLSLIVSITKICMLVAVFLVSTWEAIGMEAVSVEAIGVEAVGVEAVGGGPRKYECSRDLQL